MRVRVPPRAPSPWRSCGRSRGRAVCIPTAQARHRARLRGGSTNERSATQHLGAYADRGPAAALVFAGSCNESNGLYVTRCSASARPCASRPTKQRGPNCRQPLKPSWSVALGEAMPDPNGRVSITRPMCAPRPQSSRFRTGFQSPECSLMRPFAAGSWVQARERDRSVSRHLDPDPSSHSRCER
jgi:hypothetical protein